MNFARVTRKLGSNRLAHLCPRRSASASPRLGKGKKIMRDHAAACRAVGRPAGRGREGENSPSRAYECKARPGIALTRYILTLSGRSGRQGPSRPGRQFNETYRKTRGGPKQRQSCRPIARFLGRPSIRPCRAVVRCQGERITISGEIVRLPSVMSGGAVKTSLQQQRGGPGGGGSSSSGEAKMGGDGSITEGDLPPTDDIRPEHVLRYNAGGTKSSDS